MNRRPSTITALAFAATLLSSCGSDPQTGTSSETQTELQLLADNSRWISQANALPPSRSTVSARRSIAPSTQASMDCPMDSSTQYEGFGRFRRVWRGRCLAATDSLADFRRKRTLEHSGNGTIAMDYAEYDSRSAWFSTGHGHWRLRGGLELGIDTFRVASESLGFSLWYRFRYADACTFEYRATLETTDAGAKLPDRVLSPVTCGAKRIGTVVWDSAMGMQVQDLEGRNILPLARPEVSFREDSLGLQLVALHPRSATDPTPVGGRFRLRLLDDEFIPDTARFSARDTGGFGSYLTSWPGRAYRDGFFEADFSYAPYKPWQIEVRGGSWEAISSPILP